MKKEKKNIWGNSGWEFSKIFDRYNGRNLTQHQTGKIQINQWMLYLGISYSHFKTLKTKMKNLEKYYEVG